jgi:hypothetical protein
MKAYVVVLLLLKISMIIQIALIFGGLDGFNEDHLVYLISDLLFKTILGLFLIFFFYINGSSNFDTWDEVFIGFGGALLVFDAFYNVFPKILKKFNIYFNPYTFYLSKVPETK